VHVENISLSQTNLESNFGEFILDSSNSGSKRSIHELVATIHLESSQNSGVNLENKKSLKFSYVEFKGEINSRMRLLKSSMDSLLFTVRQFFSSDDGNIFFLVQDSVIFDVFVNNLGENVDSLVLNEGVYAFSSGTIFLLKKPIVTWFNSADL
jgi:hypothetical protein